MTPIELRKRSWTELDIAESHLKQGHFDQAAYCAGFAAELALKARYCSSAGLPSLPADRTQLRKHKLDTHKLDKLLKLSDSAVIERGSMYSIDWASIADWDNEERYRAIGSIDAGSATKRVAQTRLLFLELIEHEIVYGLARGRDLILARGIDLGLLVWTRSRSEPTPWATLISSHWLDDQASRQQRSQDLVAHLLSSVPQDLRGNLASHQTELFGRGDAVPVAYYSLAQMAFVGTVSSSSFISGGSIPFADFTGILRLKHVKADALSVDTAYVLRLRSP